VMTEEEQAALATALNLARTPGVPPGPNPRVGCVVISAEGQVIGQGWHRGAGTPHAEIDALTQAGDRARDATAVVTLEPCDHQGRTGPCTQALLEAGIARVVYAVPDPTQIAGGGADRLAEHGVDVVRAEGDQADEAAAFLAPWIFAVTQERPYVTLKMAASLDGRVAASDGTSRWITSAPSRRDVHTLRAEVDAVVVGTGTAISDDPHLSIRHIDSGGYQPLPVVIGARDLPVTHHLAELVRTGDALHLRSRDPRDALLALHARQIRHVLLEGGPTIAAAWLRAGVVDRLVWYVAPIILGSGTPAIDDMGLRTLTDARRWRVVDVSRCGDDARIMAVAACRDAAESTEFDESTKGQ
jgi:diaminohydroxyphosphoribosylaminopyrimidine deaminase/5-amino-6-(5-phosphoribosylamino)uracil reductase